MTQGRYCLWHLPSLSGQAPRSMPSSTVEVTLTAGLEHDAVGKQESITTSDRESQEMEEEEQETLAEDDVKECNTYMNAIHAVGKLSGKLHILRDRLIANILLIDVLHLFDQLAFIIVVIAVVMEGASNVTVTLLASLSAPCGFRILISERRKADGA